MADIKHRVAVQLEPDTYERIRVFAFQCRTTIPEIVRRCIDAQLDAVELMTIPGVKGGVRPFAESVSKAPQRTMLQGDIVPPSATPEPKEGS